MSSLARPMRMPVWEYAPVRGAPGGTLGRLKFIAGMVSTRTALAPSAGHWASEPASLMGRETSNVAPQLTAGSRTNMLMRHGAQPRPNAVGWILKFDRLILRTSPGVAEGRW